MSTLEIKRHNTTVLDNLEPGDLVEFNRGIYSHWAVYVGGQKVIHLTGDNENGGLKANIDSGSIFTICGRRFRKAFVKVDDFWEVVDGCKANKNNGKDKKMSPDSAEEIIGRALKMVGEIDYNVLWGNCEHFASYCRYGKAMSDQADYLMAGAAIGLGALAIVGLTGGKKKKT